MLQNDYQFSKYVGIVDGKILHQPIGSLSDDLQGFSTIPGGFWFAGFLVAINRVGLVGRFLFNQPIFPRHPTKKPLLR